MAHEKIVTAFTQVQQAEAAKERLIVEGIAANNIDIISGERLRVENKEIRHPSFWQRLFGDDVDDNNAAEYNRAIQSGGVLLTVRAPKDQANHIEEELSAFAADYSSVVHNDGPLTGGEFAGETNDRAAINDQAVTTQTEFKTQNAAPAATNPALGADRDAVKLAEEQVDIGKRRVSDGAVKLRRYTVEDEVAEDVSLFDQHAEVFRRAVDESAYLNDVDWSDKTLVVEESHEIPTIAKTARVKEEVGLREEETARVETVKDTVRRQEVEVEHTDESRLAGKPDTKKF